MIIGFKGTTWARKINQPQVNILKKIWENIIGEISPVRLECVFIERIESQLNGS